MSKNDEKVQMESGMSKNDEKVQRDIAEKARDRSFKLQEAEEALGSSTEFLVLVNAYQQEPLDRREQALKELARFCVGFVEKRL